MRFLKRRRFVLKRETQGGRRLVYQVYGFVRKEALGDVADGKLNRRYYRIIRDAHAVKELVALFEPAQNGYRILRGGLVHIDRLESARESRVVFDVLLEFL